MKIAPRAALTATDPAVGIFWRVGDMLLVDRSTLAEAETYGECLTHSGGHYERWLRWQSMGAAGRASAGYPQEIGTTEYDEWPRGRIVFETNAHRFVLYADRRLQQAAIIAALKSAFGLETADVIVKSDPHYR